MSVFLDTSAILAVLDAADVNHQPADELWKNLLGGDEPLISTNYILLETIALTQNRIGMKAVHDLSTDVIPILTVHWVDEIKHNAALLALLAARRRRVSLVDYVSFGVMRELGLRRCFAFDSHFREQGFECLPGRKPNAG